MAMVPVTYLNQFFFFRIQPDAVVELFLKMINMLHFTNLMRNAHL